MFKQQPVDVARESYLAFARKDRLAMERLLAEDFRFTSPLDNHIDRDAFFQRCWPNSDSIDRFDFVYIAAAGDRVFVTYEATDAQGRRFRSTETLLIRVGKISAVEVYFGWSRPHPAAEGKFVAAGDHP